MVQSVFVVVAYMMGSVSFGLLFAARQRVDLRAIGSGNIGATNVGRALGKRTGRIVMLLDMLKGLVPTAIAAWVFELPGIWLAATGFAAAFGHCYPIWHGFAGGKGAATSAGVLLGALPAVGSITLGVFLVTRKLSGRASVASLTASTAAVVVAGALHGRGWELGLAVGLWALVVVRHRDNIKRLLAGTEPRSSAVDEKTDAVIPKP